MKKEDEVLNKRLKEIESGIDEVLEKGSENDDILEIMKDLLITTKIKNKMSDYL